jgi:hypothetical protein
VETGYIYLIDVSGAAEAHSAEISPELQRLAVESGTDAVVVQGPQNLSAELFEFLHKHAPKDFDRLEHLFHQVSSLVISEGALQVTTEPVYVVPLIPQGEDAKALQPLLREIVSGL